MLKLNRRNVLIVLAGALIPALLLAKTGEVRLKGKLAGGAIAGVTPSGSAEFRSNAAKARSSFEVEVEHVNLPAGTVLDVEVDGTKVGTIKLGGAPEQEGGLELNTQDGETVPAIAPGAVVTIRNGAAGILSGTLN